MIAGHERKKGEKPRRREAIIRSVVEYRNLPEGDEDFLRQFPKSEFESLAREMLEALKPGANRP
jgi:hypothetical protein